MSSKFSGKLTKDRVQLIQAILDDGLRTYANLPTPAERLERARMDQDQAEEWLMSGSEEPGTFLWCCYTLALDPEEMRDGAVAERVEEEAKKR